MSAAAALIFVAIQAAIWGLIALDVRPGSHRGGDQAQLSQPAPEGQAAPQTQGRIVLVDSVDREDR